MKKNEKGLFEAQSDRNKNLIQKHIKSERYLRKSSLKTKYLVILIKENSNTCNDNLNILKSELSLFSS